MSPKVMFLAHCYLFCIHKICGLDQKINLLLTNADDTTLIAVIPSPDERQLVAESMNRDLAKIRDWCSLWGMKLNPNKMLFLK